MSTSHPLHQPVSEDELHAFADAQLHPSRHASVEAWLRDHPSDASRVEEWRSQNARIRSLLDPILEEPVPPRLIQATTRPGRARTLLLGAAAASILAAGLAGGWIGRGWLDSPASRGLVMLPERAAVAHRVFVVEVRHPVEVAASEEAHLVAWLTKRMGHRVAAPNLAEVGFTLVGGRLLAGRTGPACQLMYEDRSGKRVTVYIAENQANEQTAFRFREESGVATFYWLDGPLGYAVSGDMGRSELLSLAERIYRQLRL